VLAVAGVVYAVLVVSIAVGAEPMHVVHRDSLDYIRLASHLADHGVLGFDPAVPSARRELLYPLFLAAFMKVGLVTPFETSPQNFWPVLAVQSALYLLAVALVTVRTCQHWSSAVARTSVVLGAAYPPLAKYSLQLLSEALTIALVALAFFLLTRPTPGRPRAGLALASVLLGLLALLKSVMLPVAPLVAAFLVRARRVSWQAAAVLTLVALAFPAAWTARNHAEFGRVVVSTSDGASSLYRGNMTLGYQPPGFGDPAIPEPVRAQQARLGIEAGPYLTSLVVQRAVAAPAEFALQLLYKLCVLLVGDPRSSDGPASFAMRVAFLLLVVARFRELVSSREVSTRLTLGFTIYLSLAYSALLTSPRYFAPAALLLLPFAAQTLWQRFAWLAARLARA
jgi:hypothetical protein